jgi:3-hydroxyisobutyrate dehydrogenase-like beta-hydroxyacid dehydrogenase
MVRIGFMGFGEAARAFCDSLAPQGIGFTAYDILLDEETSAETMRIAMRERQVTIAETPAVLRDAD